MTKTDCVIFDIDGTLANCDHRRHLVAVNFAAFEAGCAEDTPFDDVVWLYKHFHSTGVKIILCSGRQELYRPQTEEWLKSVGIHAEEMYMRPTGDCRKDSIIKSQFLDAILENYNVRMAFDDRQQVVDMWRERGITCAQVREWVEGNKQKYMTGRLTLMVGPSGAGKSTWISKMVGRVTYDATPHPDVFSSDAIRQQINGNITDQSQNQRVFDYMHAVVKARLEHGFDTTVDATNLRNKDRLTFVDLVPDAHVSYIVIDRPLDEKLRDRGWRSEELVRRHDQLFKSNLKFILRGDDRPNVTVHDKRKK